MTPSVLPLDSLLIRLKQNNILIDPSVRVKVQLVLNRLGKEYLDRPDQLKQILGPVLVNNETEQELFREVFDQWYKEEILIDEFSEKVETNSNNEELNVKAKIQKRRVWLYPIAALLIFMVFAAYNYLNRPANYEYGNQNSNEIPVETPLDAAPSITEADTKIEEFIENGSEKIMGDLPTRIIVSNPKDLTENEKVSFSFDKPITSEQAIAYWEFGAGQHTNDNFIFDDSGNSPEYTYSKSGIYHIKAHIQIDETTVRTLHRSVIIHPQSMSLQALHREQLKANEAKQATIKLFVTLIAFFLIVFIEGYLYNYGRSIYTLAFRREFAASERGNYKLPFPAQNQSLEAEPALYELAHSLKYRYAGTSTVLDIPATIDATVKSGGLPDLQYTTRTEASEYLVLIDESGPEDYQAKLFEQLMVLLKQEEVPIHLFRFRNDPRHCYNHLFPDGLELEVLAQKFHRHKLLIFSKGSFLVDPVGYGLHEWVEPLMKRWSYRALLTPEPVRDWSIRERALQNCFTLLPTDLESQKGITEALLAEEQPDFGDLKEELLARKQHSTPLEDYDFESIEDLQNYLGDTVFQWLAASSVYPEPSWEMTLKIGQALEKDTELIGVVNENYGEDFTADALNEARKLVTYENLTKLSSIPWLREGKISPEIRSLLQSNLDSETEKLARSAALELIESVDTEEGSGIAREKKIQATIQESALHPQDKLLSKKLRFLWGEDLLSKEETEALPQHLQPSWQMELLKNIPVKPILTAMLSLLILGIGGWQAYQYSQRDLFEKYFAPFPVEIPSSFSENDDLPSSSYIIGVTEYKNGNYKAAIEHLFISSLDLDVLEHPPLASEIIQFKNQSLTYLGIAYLANHQPEKAIDIFQELKNDETLGDLAKWYSSLALIANDQEEQAKILLMGLASQEESSNYQLMARRLLREL